MSTRGALDHCRSGGVGPDMFARSRFQLGSRWPWTCGRPRSPSRTTRFSRDRQRSGRPRRRHVTPGALECCPCRDGSRGYPQSGTIRPAEHVRTAVPRLPRGPDQVRLLLGHVSIQTTERYLGCKQSLRAAVNDRMGIEPDSPYQVNATADALIRPGRTPNLRRYRSGRLWMRGHLGIRSNVIGRSRSL